jgi:hypothetical protein
LGVIRAAGQIGKGRAVQVIREIGQSGLCKTTVLRQKSCQTQKKIKQNQQLTDSSSLSSVDCVSTACWRSVHSRCCTSGHAPDIFALYSCRI